MNTNKTNKKTNTRTRAKLDSRKQSAIICSMRQRRRGNHHGTLVSRGKGKNLIARFSYRGKVHQYSTHTTDVSEAYRILDNLTYAFRQDSLADSLKKIQEQILDAESRRERIELPIEDIWEAFSSKGWKGTETESTKNTHKTGVNKLVDFLKKRGIRYASQVTAEIAEAFDKAERAAISGVAYNNRLVFLKRVWRQLDSDNKYAVVANVWEGFAKITGKATQSNRRALTKAETDALLKKADDSLRLLVTISLYSGMRFEDCAILKWSDVDMSGSRLNVTPAKTKAHGTKISIKIAPQLFAELQKAQETATGEYVSTQNAAEHKTGTLGRRVRGLFDACGIQTSERDENGKLHILTGFHALRHTVATNLLDNGVSPNNVCAIMGWKSLKMLDRYMHGNVKKIDEAIDAISNAA